MINTVITPPSAEPVSLSEAKLHLRVENNLEDAFIGSLITAARQMAEHYTGRVFVNQTIQTATDEFSDPIVLPVSPVIAIVSVKYIDANGAEQTISSGNYVLHKDDQSPYIRPAYGTAWPSVRGQDDAVRISYTAGYGAAADVPAAIKQYILLHVANYYKNRESLNVGNIVNEMPFVKTLLDPFRRY